MEPREEKRRKLSGGSGQDESGKDESVGIVTRASGLKVILSIPGLARHILEFATSHTREAVWYGLVSKAMRAGIRESELYLTETHITDAMVVSMVNLQLKRLKALSVRNNRWNTDLTDRGLWMLCRFTTLTILTLHGCHSITDTGLQNISSLSTLTSLNLFNCSIADTGLQFISLLARLTSLDLYKCSITDTGVQTLSSLSTLTSLDLRWCGKITAEGIRSLSSLRALKRLNIEGCGKITADFRSTLRSIFPLLETEA